MKKLIIILCLISLSQTYSMNLSGYIDDAFCGEMDPFVVGDVCIVFINQNNTKLGFLMDYDEFLSNHNPDDLIGETILFEKNNISKIRNPHIIDTLRKYDDNYFYVDYSGPIIVRINS